MCTVQFYVYHQNYKNVNELEQIINVASSNNRKSRPRFCDIDRATVLSINRKLTCRRVRDLSWPPINLRNKLVGRTKFSDNTTTTYKIYVEHLIERKIAKTLKRFLTKSRLLYQIKEKHQPSLPLLILTAMTTQILPQATIIITILLKVST